MLNESFASSIHSTGVRRNGAGAPLYIICERSQVKSFRSAELAAGQASTSASSRYIFVPVDLHDVKDTKNSFKKLCRACVPSAASQELLAEINSGQSQNPNRLKAVHPHPHLQAATKSSFVGKFGRKKSTTQSNLMAAAAVARGEAPANGGTGNVESAPGSGFYKQLHESKWFEQIKALLDVANTICDRMDDGSSVMVALEDGWDLTAQVVALAELMMDPYYRTIEGFCVLVEREWLAMGHRFTRRNNHTIDDQTGFAPIFLQFLDCVYQCMQQHPAAFEFSPFLLEFLAYHSVSNRFRTFLLDSELERVQFGVERSSFPAPTSLPSSSRRLFQTNVTHSQASSIAANTTCIWQYILKVHYHSAKFFNFTYQPVGGSAFVSLRLATDVCRVRSNIGDSAPYR